MTPGIYGLPNIIIIICSHSLTVHEPKTCAYDMALAGAQLFLWHGSQLIE